jgi:hypothetical protein
MPSCEEARKSFMSLYNWLGIDVELLTVPAGENTAAENKPVERAREVITDLKSGRIPRSVVRDLGEAVNHASRDQSAADAIGRNWNR